MSCFYFYLPTNIIHDSEGMTWKGPDQADSVSLHFSFNGKEYLCLRLLTAPRWPQTLKRIRVHVSKSIKELWNIHGRKQTLGAASEYSASDDKEENHIRSSVRRIQARPGEERLGLKHKLSSRLILKINCYIIEITIDFFVCFFLLRSELLDKWEVSNDWTDQIGSPSIFMQTKSKQPKMVHA